MEALVCFEIGESRELEGKEIILRKADLELSDTKEGWSGSADAAGQKRARRVLACAWRALACVWHVLARANVGAWEELPAFHGAWRRVSPVRLSSRHSSARTRNPRRYLCRFDAQRGGFLRPLIRPRVAAHGASLPELRPARGGALPVRWSPNFVRWKLWCRRRDPWEVSGDDFLLNSSLPDESGVDKSNGASKRRHIERFEESMLKRADGSERADLPGRDRADEGHEKISPRSRLGMEIKAETEQIGTETEQIKAETEQIGAETEQIGAKTEQIKAETEQIGAETEQIKARRDRFLRYHREILLLQSPTHQELLKYKKLKFCHL
uniref:Uncharacterized protein n=1 Tax=Fagus sylvatica TaxID=28930 RepID=A0A2N9IX30_FAGSY